MYKIGKKTCDNCLLSYTKHTHCCNCRIAYASFENHCCDCGINYERSSEYHCCKCRTTFPTTKSRFVQHKCIEQSEIEIFGDFKEIKNMHTCDICYRDYPLIHVLVCCKDSKMICHMCLVKTIESKDSKCFFCRLDVDYK